MHFKWDGTTTHETVSHTLTVNPFTVLDLNFSIVLQVDEAMYGIDWNAPFSSDDETVDSVTVPVSECPLSPDEMTQLRVEVDPLAETEDYGISQYLVTVDFVQSKIDH